MKNFSLAIALMSVLGLSTACGNNTNAAPSVLRVSGIPDSKGTEIDALAAVESYLGKELGMKVEYINATNYDAAVTMMGSNKIDLGWFGGVTGVDAVDACEGKARMIATREKDLQFKTYFIANRAVVDAGKVGAVDSLEQLAPKLAGAVVHIWQHALDVGPYHAALLHGGCRHRSGQRGQGRRQEPGKSSDDTLEKVADGRIDVGALNYTSYESASDDKKRQAVKIFETPTYVDYCLVARGSLGDDLIAKIQAGLHQARCEERRRARGDARRLQGRALRRGEVLAVAERFAMSWRTCRPRAC